MTGPSASQDDPRRIERTLETYRGYLLSVAQALRGGATGDRASPSDLVQEAMIAAVLKARAGRMPEGDAAHLRSWLRTILVRLHVSEKRREHARKRAGLLRVDFPGDVPPSDPGTPPTERVARAELVGLIGVAFAGLAEEDQQLVRWRYRDGESFEEIGRRLGCSAAYAGRVSRRALDRLRSALPPDGDGGPG